MSRTGFIQNELDLKLLVLYIMARAAAPITFLQLLDLALCDAGVDYFSLTEAVNHLVETEHLAQEGPLLHHGQGPPQQRDLREQPPLLHSDAL